MLRPSRSLLLLAVLLADCGSDAYPTTPTSSKTLTVGRWAGQTGQCLSVAPAESDLIAGCSRGHFPTPALTADGTFAVDGTIRFEGGPSSDRPPLPARFTGAVKGSVLTLTVQQTGSANDPAVLSLTFAGEGTCTPLCV
jgi:hypothetical protein